VSSNARCLQLSEELDENIKELQSKEEHLTESKAKIKKVMSLCSWRMGKALVESAIPVCVKYLIRDCSARLAKLSVGSRPGSVVEAVICWRVRSRSDKGGVERMGLQVSVHGCVGYFVSVS